jgi:TPR repeat protein
VQSNAAYIYDNGFVKQSHEDTNALEQGALSGGPEGSDEASGLDLQTVSIASDVRAKRLLDMAQQEGSSSAALRLGDYAFYGYGSERTALPLGSLANGELEAEAHETVGGLAIHHGIRCDASGMFPILGTRWHKVGEDFDLCEAEYQKLTESEQNKFELVELVPVKEGVDYKTAITHYRVAAEQGVAQAAYSLGHM